MTCKLQTLAEIEGYVDIPDMLMEAVTDSLVPAICTNAGCDYGEAMEPDQDRGWCEECQTPSVKSCLVLAHLI